jgi:ATP-dependent protease HslVU (ClpYQ) peptidase subunit
MTCIIGMEYHDRVYIAADSMSASGWDRDVTAMSKLHMHGNILFGFADSPRRAQIVKHIWRPTEKQVGESDEEYLVTHVVEGIRKAYKEHGCIENDNGADAGIQLMLGYKGKLYTVENHFQLTRSARGIAALGVGADYALGAIGSINADFEHPLKSSPSMLLTHCLKVAQEFSSGVSAPFEVKCI